MEKNVALLVVYLGVLIVPVFSNSESVKLFYLKGVMRFNTASTDYYFCCNVIGNYLQWQYKNELLTGFNADDEVGASRVVDETDFRYTVTLLSSESIGDGNTSINSVIILSFDEAVRNNFTITCSKGLMSKTVSAGIVSEVEDSSLRHNSYHSIILDYVIKSIKSHKIVRNSTTHIFMCGTINTPQSIQVNSLSINFTSSDELGFHRNVSGKMNSDNVQVILIALHPLMTTAIFVNTNNSNVEVSCSDWDMLTTLNSNGLYTTSPTSARTTYQNNYFNNVSTVTSDIGRNFTEIIGHGVNPISVSVSVLAIIISLVVIVLIILLLCTNYKKLKSKCM